MFSSNERKERLPEDSLIVEMFPNEGTLEPYQEQQVFFRFSPRFTKPKSGWRKEEKLAPRRDYALFMQIKSVGMVNTVEEGKILNYFNFNFFYL